MRNTFRKYERLKREQHIRTLFREGKAFSVLQVRFLYRVLPRDAELSPARAGFSIPKKKFRSSVQRHKMRRLVTEAWRMNKQQLYNTIPADKQLHLFIIVNNTEPLDFSKLQEIVQQGITKLKEKVA